MNSDDLVGRIKQIAPVKWLRRMRHRRRFWTGKDLLHLGVYQSFQEALEEIPKGTSVGWDRPETAAMFRRFMHRINPRDYPVLFWMQTLWRDKVTVFDYGGHVGTKRYAFERYLSFDADKHWIVCDVPEVIGEGRKIAEQRNTLNMSFTTDFQGASECTLLICLGVLQFIEEPLAGQLRRLSVLPPHIIANGVPLHPHLSYVTLVNIEGNGFCPYRIFQRDEFIASIEALGYRLVDEWANAEKGCRISVDEEFDVDQYSGLYFRRT